ncbi:hypothetical protein PT274_02815 [Leuconostocaceae bacterium ESL0958]|nr:hypothetical protein [Leuconostocaceae bacterium ESL0958]
MAGADLALAEAAFPKDLAQLQQANREDRLSHLYLLVGPGDAEKLALAKALAAEVLGTDEETVARIEHFDHPDLVPVLASDQQQTIKIAQVRALIPELTTTTLEGPKKVFIIDHADTLTTAAANFLLKFIEEPAGPQLILLLADKEAAVLPTIQSRAQVLILRPTDQVLAEQAAATTDQAERLWPAVQTWFFKALARDISALAYLQTDLLPLVGQPADEQQVLQWLLALGRDLALFAYLPTEQLHFPALATQYQQAQQRYQAAQLLAVAELIFELDQQWAVHLSFQSRLDQLSLKMSLILGKS